MNDTQKIFAALCLVLALAAVSRAEEVKPLSRPAYPLYTISSKKIAMTEQDTRLLAENFQVIHARMSREQFAAIHKVNPDFKCLIYINSTYTRSASDIATVESKYRGSLCMHLAASLTSAIGPADTQIQVAAVDGSVKRGKGGSQIPIRASTIAGDQSASDDTSTKRYVFWIRVGDELMRVNAFDPATGKLNVERGFAGSKAASHVTDDNVFSPVYLGFRRAHKEKYPGCHPEGPGKHLRYVLDPHSEPGYRFQAELALAKMREDGADGVWIDTLNTGDFNLSDCLGRPVRPWDFAKQQVYTHDDFRIGQEKKIDFMQRYVHERLGKYPFLVANNLKPTTYQPGHGGMRQLLASTKVKPRPLDGFCMEGGLSWHKADDEEEDLAWRARVQIIMDAAQNGLAAMPILGGAGSKSVTSEPDTPGRDRIERFGYASYLLGVEKNGRTMMGTYAFYQADGKRFVKIHRMYYYPIGEPAETVQPDEVDRYRAADSPIYRRRFTGGLVLVNPSSKEAVLAIDAGYFDPDNGQSIRKLVMPAGSGKILLKSSETKDK